MGNLIGFFLRQPLLVRLIFFGVLGFGVYAASIAQKEGFPAVDLNMVTVSTTYPGASPEDVELNVTTLLEDEISEVDGLYEMASTSRDNFSAIVISADEDASPEVFAGIVNDIQQAVDQTSDLPLDLDGVSTLKVASTSDRPIIVINLFGEHELLRRVLPLVENDLESLDGVSGVDKIGYFDREVHIEIDPVKARALRISTSDVLRAIEARNLRSTGGILESYLDEQTVVTLNKFSSPKEVEQVILRSSITGQGVTVGDVAQVVLREKDEHLIVRNEGKPGMSLVIRKKTNADIVDTIARVKSYMAAQPLLEGVGLSYSSDESARTRLRLQVLGGNAVIGFVLVALILMLVLNMRAAFWTAMSVPFSLLGTIILVAHYGITINVVSLAGFVLVLGLLVDDAIVIAEKVTYYREKGLSPQEAARKGATDMWRPVTVASLTTILAFSPMFQLGGMPGKFAWAIPAVVIIALLVSLFDSFFVLPHHLTGGPTTISKGKPGWMLAMERAYGRLLHHMLHGRYLVVLVMLALLGGGAYLVKNHMKFQIFPQDGVETFYLMLEMPRGASLSATSTRLQELEQLIAALPDNELESYSTRVGTHSIDASKNRGDHSNLGIISVYLTGEARRDRSADDIMLVLRGQVEPVKGQQLLFDKQRIGPTTGKPIELRISSNDDTLRQQTAADLLEYLTGLPGLLDVESDNKPGKDQLIVEIDYQRLAEVGLTVKTVAEALRVTYDGVLVSSTTSVEETLEYRVIMAPDFRDDPDVIFEIPVVNNRGRVMTLEGLLHLRRGQGPLEFHHIDGIRTETLTGDIDITVTTVGQVSQQVSQWVAQHLQGQPHVQIEMAGESREAKKIFGGFISAGLMALVAIFLLVALLLNSLGQSLIVMSAIPFAVVGVIYAFFAHGQTLSFFSTMGMLGLIGVVVNDTILMVTEANRELHENPKGNLVATTVQGACNRLRPVLLTTLTTVVGLLPTAYGIGGKDALIMPLTLAIAYGLMFATLVTLIFTPVLLVIGHDMGRLIGRGTSHRRGREPGPPAGEATPSA